MSQQRSPFTGRRYPLTTVCATYRVARATVMCTRRRPGRDRRRSGARRPRQRRGVLEAIWQVLVDSPFHGEGHRKVRTRLRALGYRVGRHRVLGLMRAAGLLAPQCGGHPHGDPAHAGTITTERPNVMWGTDATRFYTARDGWCWWFGAIDHASADIVGWHAAKIGDRWAALEPIRTGARLAFGAFAKDVARGRTVRSDWGPQYIADVFGNEPAWLGITHSHSFVREPQCNGVIERFIRTLSDG